LIQINENRISSPSCFAWLFQAPDEAMAAEKTIALRRVKAFSALPRALLGKIGEASGIQRLGKGSTLFCEGEKAHYVYVLMEGRVSLTSGLDCERATAGFAVAGEIILVPPVLLDIPYMVTATAVTDLVVMLIPARDLVRLVRAELALSVAVGRVVAEHWHSLILHLLQLRIRDADGRLLQYLLDGAGTNIGTAQFTLPTSKKDLAAYLCITPETLSRSFRRLSRLGVKTLGPQIRIEDVSILRQAFGR
jgi:CRP/FNR family transcriptional activator FtrB